MADITLKVIIKHNLETSIISITLFTVCFPERISNIQKWQNAPFLVSFSGMITLELHRKHLSLEY